MKNNIPKGNIFRVPEGYFESLPDQIMAKKLQNKQHTTWISGVAAAITVILTSLLFFKLLIEPTAEPAPPSTLAVDEEIEMLIDRGHWNAEDVLSLSDDPNVILDELLYEHWRSYPLSESDLEEELWYYY